MKKAEYFVYCDFFITHLWMERFAQIPKGEFLEVPCSLKCSAPQKKYVIARRDATYPDVAIRFPYISNHNLSFTFYPKQKEGADESAPSLIMLLG